MGFTFTEGDSGQLTLGSALLRQLAGAVHLAQQDAEAKERESQMVRRSFGVSVKSIDIEKRSVRVVASTPALDSYDEIVEQDWDLSRYEANPVVLYRHNQPAGFLGSLSAEETLPIGFATDVAVVDGKLEATLTFVNADATPLAEKVLQGFAQKSLRAVSVGFYPRDIREERRDDKDVFVLSNNELVEISVVPIGANPEAVAKTAEANRAQLRRLMTPPAQSGPEQPNQESDMDPKQIEKLQAELAAANEKVAAGEQALKDAQATLAERDQNIATLTKERDEAQAEANKANAEVIKQEVTALVGKKITPAEKDAMIELRTEKPELFAKIIESRSEIGLSATVLSKDSEPNAVSKGAVPASALGDEAAAEAEKKVAEFDN